jgi:hypothetical protein
MYATARFIKASGGCIARLDIAFNGITLPVNVYPVSIKKADPFILCVCYEDSPIETRLYLDKTPQGWKERCSNDHELADLIGPQVESLRKQRMYN